MIRLMVFDLDNTLAALGKGIRAEDLALLRQLEARGVRIALCSGKSVDYLCGLLRQVELRAPILIGENGAVIRLGVELPPREYCLPVSKAAKEGLRLLREELSALLPEMWFQPNQVGLTPFPADEREFALVADCIERNRPHLRDIAIYRHCDSFDITPAGIDKGAGVAYLGRLLGIPAAETAAIGDGPNDYPMFEYAGLAVGIRAADESKVQKNFQTPTAALQYLLSL